MDLVRGPGEHGSGDEGIGGETMVVGTDERRMHVRAYNHWVSLLNGRSCPVIADLDPGSIADFGANSVLLDFTDWIDDPAIRFLGHALRSECGADTSMTHVSQVPGRSLLSRLTDHYLQIIANQAPIGFEAEFVGTRGFPMMYRGILMPYSSTGETIDYLYGVINWKELVDDDTQSLLTAQLEESRRTAPRPALATAWADGPSAGIGETPADRETLADRLEVARERADAADVAEETAYAARIAALGSAYDLTLAIERDADGYAAMLADAGLRHAATDPIATVVRLVFGEAHAEAAAVLSHARRSGVSEGGLPALITGSVGGLTGLVRAERACELEDR